jgi:hypothetical protein
MLFLSYRLSRSSLPSLLGIKWPMGRRHPVTFTVVTPPELGCHDILTKENEMVLRVDICV